MIEGWPVWTLATAIPTFGCNRNNSSLILDLFVADRTSDSRTALGVVLLAVNIVMKTTLRMGAHVEPSAIGMPNSSSIVATVRPCGVIEMPNNPWSVFLDPASQKKQCAFEVGESSTRVKAVFGCAGTTPAPGGRLLFFDEL